MSAPDQKRYDALLKQRDEWRELSVIYYDALREIRDSTYRSAVVLRGMAANAIDNAKSRGTP